MVGIENITVDEEFLKDKVTQELLPKDYAFAHQVAYKDGLIIIPGSAFFDKSTVEQGTNYLRFAFCKDKDLITKSGDRIKP